MKNVNTKQTSPKVASVASKVLKDKNSSKAAKTTAGSALSQARPSSRKGRK